ncbi:MAG TPA: ATPase, T2SS/T4P/T4SS family, partial [Actinomycetota bacterium]|nr:ATPase, T2SS/T4P/T4SS family [Actinomycetota bacterium]
MFRKARLIEDDLEQTDVLRLLDAGGLEPGFETSGGHADHPQMDHWPPLPGSPKLGELLVQKQLVTHAQVSEALLQQSASGKRLGTLLVELGVLDERNLAATVAEQLGLPLADLSRQAPEPEALKLLPEAVARRLRAMPLRITAAGLEIALADPGPKIREDLARAAGREVILLVAPASDVRRAIDNFYRALTGIESEVEAFRLAESSRQVEPVIQQTVTADAPVVKVVNRIITQGLRDRASDIHIEPQDDRLRIRYRIDGALHDVIALPSSMAPAVISRLK